MSILDVSYILTLFTLFRVVSWRGRVVRFRDGVIDKRGDRRQSTAENLQPYIGKRETENLLQDFGWRSLRVTCHTAGTIIVVEKI